MQPTAASIWFEIWESWIRVKKSIFPDKFPKNFDLFLDNFTQKIRFSRQISEKFRYYKAISQELRFSREKLAIYSYFWANYSMSLQSHHFRTYFLYMIRYNNISRPVHDPHDPSLPKIWGN